MQPNVPTKRVYRVVRLRSSKFLGVIPWFIQTMDKKIVSFKEIIRLKIKRQHSKTIIVNTEKLLST